MKYNRKNLVVFFLLFSLIISLFPAVSAAPSSVDVVTDPTGYQSASDVTYSTVGGYVVNWGARGEDCVFLSSNAREYYVGGYTYDVLSALSGGTSQTNASDSALYSALQDMMAENHTNYTSYGGSSKMDCKNLYLYTDCMKNNTAYVSTLYQGETVSSTWDSGETYNQEHVWPKSKCVTTNEIGDIMHLRPANPIENSTRGNTAYGEGQGYYDPGVSVRGDCARMILYMYVRWGNTANMWGTAGVMESVDILLKWMEEDPVDTWEMGRNDAVESITGTRNVFVDYPEYTWHLFGRALPENLITPSGNSGNTGESGDLGEGGGIASQAALVTDISALNVGDQIVIVSAESDYAMSIEQKTNNRGQVVVTKSADGKTISLSADTQIITLEAGTLKDTFAFSVGEGQYLYAASSSGNHLKTTDALTDNGSWGISIDGTTGIAAITASGENIRNVMRYNASSSLFSCYDAINTQKDICIYVIGDQNDDVPDSGGSGEPEEPVGTTASLVTGTSSLHNGDKIIVVAAEHDYAIGTTQNKNNRAQAVITKSTDGKTVSYDDETQIITLEAGSLSNTFALKVGEGQYLCTASSSGNYLRTTDAVSDEASWTISIDELTGIAVVTGCGMYTHNVMRYNTSASLFACYSENNTQKDICVYKVSSAVNTPDSCDHLWSGGVCTACGNVCGHETYENGLCIVCGQKEPVTEEGIPEITFKYPTLSFEGEVYYNVYFEVSNADVRVEDLGLLTWYTRPASLAQATVDTAEENIPGAVSVGESGVYMVRTGGVPAKMLGDNMYLRIYAKLNDGSYAYSPVTYYSAKYYANDILANSQGGQMKSLVVAMLNYGAAAQIHFNHNTDNLMNADLTAEQRAFVMDYSDSMIGDLVAVDINKVGEFQSNGGFSGGYPSVSFEGAFSINYYLTPKQNVSSKITLYCWDLTTYESVSELTVENAVAKITMSKAGTATQYIGSYAGIAAKQIDETVFAAAVYESDGVRYRSPIITYSLGSYCRDQIVNGSDTMKAFAEATVVYGDAARTYFVNINA